VHQKLFGTSPTLLSLVDLERQERAPASTPVHSLNTLFASLPRSRHPALLQDHLLCFASSTWKEFLEDQKVPRQFLFLVPFVGPLDYARHLEREVQLPPAISLRIWESCYRQLLAAFPHPQHLAFVPLQSETFSSGYPCLIQETNQRLAARTTAEAPWLVTPSKRRVTALFDQHRATLPLSHPDGADQHALLFTPEHHHLLKKIEARTMSYTCK